MVVDDASSFFWFAMLPFAGSIHRAIGTMRRRQREKDRLNSRVGKALGSLGQNGVSAPRSVTAVHRPAPRTDPSVAFRAAPAPRAAGNRSLELTPEQLAEAERLEERLTEVIRGEIRELALFLASKSNHQLLRVEFEVRDRVKTIGVKAIETALAERKR